PKRFGKFSGIKGSLGFLRHRALQRNDVKQREHAAEHDQANRQGEPLEKSFHSRRERGAVSRSRMATLRATDSAMLSFSIKVAAGCKPPLRKDVWKLRTFASSRGLISFLHFFP